MIESLNSWEHFIWIKGFLAIFLWTLGGRERRDFLRKKTIQVKKKWKFQIHKTGWSKSYCIKMKNYHTKTNCSEIFEQQHKCIFCNKLLIGKLSCTSLERKNNSSNEEMQFAKCIQQFISIKEILGILLPPLHLVLYHITRKVLEKCLNIGKTWKILFWNVNDGADSKPEDLLHSL